MQGRMRPAELKALQCAVEHSAQSTHTRKQQVGGAHALHVVARMPPVTLRVDVAQVQAVLLAELDPRSGHRHLRWRRRVRPAHRRTPAPHTCW